MSSLRSRPYSWVSSVDLVVPLHRLDLVLLQTIELTLLIWILILLSISLLKYKI